MRVVAMNKRPTTGGRHPKVNAAAAERLHQAVRSKGGNQAVAKRSGVPLGTLNNYVRGRNGMKMKTLEALAGACDVTVEWIVSGDRRPGPGFAPKSPPPPSSLGEAAQAAAPVPSGGLDVANLAKAIEIVHGIAGNAALNEDTADLARRIASVYAVLIRSATAPGL